MCEAVKDSKRMINSDDVFCSDHLEPGIYFAMVCP